MQPGHDAEYRSAADWTWLKHEGADEILVIGAVDEETARQLEEHFDEVKVTSMPFAVKSVRSGAYLFVRGFRRLGVIALSGEARGIDLSERLLHSDTHLADAWQIYEHLWPSAPPLLGGSDFAPGQYVVVRGFPSSIGRVTAVRRLADHHEISVDIDLNVRQFAPDDLTLLDGDPRSPSFWAERAPGRAAEIAQTLTWLKLANPITDLLYSFATTRTTFKPYQFIPVLKLLRSSTGRLLIADEVGLGKTIEAGLIMTELDQRNSVKRLLVITPAALRFKWQDEMRRRFMRPLKLLSAADLDQFCDMLEEGGSPGLTGIMTLESFRGRDNLLQRLVDLHPDFDLVVFDEAHYLRNRRTQAFHVGEVFQDLADTLVFLSATPLNLGESDLFNLIHTLDPGGFPDESVFADQLAPNAHLNEVLRLARTRHASSAPLMKRELEELRRTVHGQALSQRPDFGRLQAAVSDPHPSAERVAEIARLVSELNTLGQVFTRTRKIDLPDRKAVRDAREVLVDWTPEERLLYESVYAFYKERAIRSASPAAFIMQMPLRMAASSLPVLQRHLGSREGWQLDEGELDVDDEALSDGAADLDDELRLRVLRTRLNHDTKLERLIAQLHAAREGGNRQALIFSFFRGTVTYLVEALQKAGFRSEALHGGVDPEHRQVIMNRFREGQFDVLVSNQVGAEGLDFQFCNVLVNYDLPWNPMQVEQRIGRLDRFGQQAEKIFIFNLVVPGTIESDILSRLYHRIGVFERSIGALEPILRSEISRINTTLLDPRLTPTEREKELDRIAVALQTREQQIRELEESSGLLASLHQLEIEGLESNGPTGGRFVGAAERARLLEYVIRSNGGAIRFTERGATLEGSAALASKLRQIDSPDVGTELRGRLPQLLRDGAHLAVTFDPNDESAASPELISNQHPLVRLAVKQLSENSHQLPRFGAVGVRNLRAGRWLVQVDVVSSQGVRPACELWYTAFDIESGERSPDIEPEIMAAHADGRFEDEALVNDAALSQAWRRLETQVVPRRFADAREERELENSALVEARFSSRRSSIQRSIARAQDLFNEFSHRGPASIARLYEGRLRNLHNELADLETEFEPKRHLNMSRSVQALLVVVGGQS